MTRGWLIGLFVCATLGCGSEGPLGPTSSFPHKAIYLVYVTEAEATALRREYPSGVFGLSPESAARRFDAPLAGSPRGIQIDWQGHEFDPAVSNGTLDPSGLRYEWVGYFYTQP